MKTIIICLLTMIHLPCAYGTEGESSYPIDFPIFTDEEARFENAKQSGQAALAELAMNDNDENVRRWAVYELSDKDLLADLAQNAKSKDVRYVVLQKIDDETVLEAILKNENNLEIRGIALRKITDPDLLAEIAENDKDENIRLAAARRAGNQTVIAEIAQNGKYDALLRQIAIGSLTNETILVELANGDDELMRSASTMRLVELKRSADNARNETDKPVLDMTDNESPTLDGIGNIDAVVESDTKTEAADANAPLPPPPPQHRWPWWPAIPVVVGAWLMFHLRKKRK